MIDRYDAYDAAVVNRALTRLEDLYKEVGNAHEIIDEGTLTANTTQVNISLHGKTWRWLRLQAVMQLNKNVWAGLRANEDSREVYHSIVFDQPTDTYFVNQLEDSAALGLLGDAGEIGSIDMWFILQPLGFVMRGTGTAFIGSGFVLDVPTQEWNPAATALATHIYAGFYRGGTVQSLQLVVPPEQSRSPLPVNPSFETGGTWMLTGVSA